MRKLLLKMCLPVALFASLGLQAQTRYIDEVFTDADIKITPDVEYGVNIDWLRTNTGASQVELITEITEVKTALALGNPIPLKYFLTNDSTTASGDSTAIKVQPLKMDVYEPMQANDYETERAVMIYIHTGNFLPPPINGQPTGRKEDLTAQEICKRWAKRGYVAVSIQYRGGWNPISSIAEVRRGTLLNAVYRALHDIKHGVRFLKDDYDNANQFAIDKNNVALYGQGSGAYVTLAYATLDKYAEMAIPKFIDPTTNPPQSYIDTTLVGRIDGTGGIMNLYTNPTNQNSDIIMTINAGGALADSSWLESGDVPMVTFHCIRDQFAPFENGDVIVTTTGDQVVEVQGPNIFMKKANALGNNSVLNVGLSDTLTKIAEAKYGNTYSYWHPIFTTITLENDIHNCYPVLLPLVTAAQAPLQNQASPWEYWDPQDPLAQAQVGVDGQGNPITAHQANLLSNPDMSMAKAHTYIDTIFLYAAPRVALVLKDNGIDIGMEENELFGTYFEIYPNPTNDIINLNALKDIVVKNIQLMDMTGRVVKQYSSTTNRLSLSGLSSGVFVLMVETNKGLLSQRIIKR